MGGRATFNRTPFVPIFLAGGGVLKRFLGLPVALYGLHFTHLGTFQLRIRMFGQYAMDCGLTPQHIQ
jgi:hypothetical protein